MVTILREKVSQRCKAAWDKISGRCRPLWDRITAQGKKLRGKATLQLKFSLSYILVIAAVLVLLNSYPLLVSRSEERR